MVNKIKSSNDNNKNDKEKNKYISVKIKNIITFMFAAILVVVIGSIFVLKLHTEKSPDHRYINVEGEAEREVIADTAEWSLYFEHVGENQSDLNKIIATEKPKVIEFLVKNGINSDEIEFLNYIKENYRKNQTAISYRMGYCVHIKTQKIKTVTKLKNNLAELFSENTGIVRNILKVSYSKQAEVEQELYKEATKNAMNKASDLTKFLKLKLGKITRIESPRFYTESLVPNVDMMGHNRFMAVSHNPEENASNEMMKRKIKANISIQMGIR